ncbi:MAG: hypothetical protein LLH30_00125 [Candidatus Manganitrophus sp. SA1]|nr:hypothetical protein [Candidatus Manganitrophus morganii]
MGIEMIVYGGQEEVVDAAEQLAQLQAFFFSLEKEGFRDHDRIVEFLIEWGVFESAVADALSPDFDSDAPLLRRLRQASLLIGHLFRLSARKKRSEIPTLYDQLFRALHDPLFSHLPPKIALRVPEGYAYYGLYPETYLESALQLLREVGPQPAVCIGIRSIGASLSAVVAAPLEAHGFSICSYTVRPRGHPFDRFLRLSSSFEKELVQKKGSYFLIIDEGPGLSGSSMTSVAEKLSELGIADDRILFFPSWEPDGSRFRSEAARGRWPRHRKIATSFEEIFLNREKYFSSLPQGPFVDFSGGRWRSHVYQSELSYPPVQPQHERRKYLSLESKEKPRLLKFAGLGRYGRSKRERAERLAGAGWGPPVVGLAHGFLVMEYVEGAPVSGGEADSSLIETMARYLAFLRETFPASRRRSFDEMIEMMRINLSEGLGKGWEGPLDRLERFRSLFEKERPAAIDGRMFPHEWLQTSEGYLKTDGVDHHDDHFFPGGQEIAWDLAGCCVEFGFSFRDEERFLGRYQALANDPRLLDRLHFYKVAYLAYRLGYATLAAEALGPAPDAARFKSLSQRYSAALHGELGSVSLQIM